MAFPLLELERMLQEIRKGCFNPDNTRFTKRRAGVSSSSAIAPFVVPAPVLIESDHVTSDEDVQSDVASDDSEAVKVAEQSAEAIALRDDAPNSGTTLQINPGDKLYRNIASGLIHIVEASSAASNRFACRRINTSGYKEVKLGAFVYTHCKQCFP